MRALTNVVMGIVVVLVYAGTDARATIDDGSARRLHESSQCLMLPDTLEAWQYYSFVHYYDSSRVTFMFGEIQWHRNSGVTWTLELVTFDSDANQPLFDNSLSGMYCLSGSDTLFCNAGDTISYFTRPSVEPENYARGSLYLGIQDTVVFYVELYDLTSGEILDTLGHWGVAPSDTLGQVHWMVSDTTIMKRYVVPDFQLESSTLLQLKVRPAFKGNTDRLSISRWDVFTTERLSQEMVLAKSVYLAWADTVLSKMAAAEAGGVAALTIELDAAGNTPRRKASSGTKEKTTCSCTCTCTKV